jgi:hypothetical protein
MPPAGRGIAYGVFAVIPAKAGMTIKENSMQKWIPHTISPTAMAAAQ